MAAFPSDDVDPRGVVLMCDVGELSTLGESGDVRDGV